MDLLESFLDYERNFSGVHAIEWTGAHTEIPVFSIVAYVAIVFYVPNYLGKDFKGLKVRSLFAAWNILLSAFSILGTINLAPVLLGNLYNNGFRYTVCTDPAEWYLEGAAGLWTTLFIYSKLPELLDTVFLVIQKKPVIFLHWFHHVTVLLYCWHAFVVRTATGLWFITMNYTVHSIMYAYYFISILGYRHYARKFAPLITTIQILQMVGGTVVTFYAAFAHASGGTEACFVDPANYKMGLGMYISYFLLFAKLFYDKYLAKSASDKQKAASKDSAGFFREDNSSRHPSEDKKGK
eukprot:m.3265 g.3265  ORF g.3265 m.3265 type:complete len:295 (-) comp2722_c0_seq1:939-1823(-)